MDPRVRQLVKGDRLEREKILHEADCEFLDELVRMIMKGKKQHFTVDERHDIAVFNEEYGIDELRKRDIPLAQKIKTLKDDGSYFIHKLLKPMIKQKRIRKDCPVPGCTSLGLLHLPNHLNNVHRYNEKDRKYWLSIARLQKAGVSTKEIISRHDGEHRSHDVSRWYNPRYGFEQSCTMGTQTGEEKQEESTQGFYAPKVAVRCATASTQTEETEWHETERGTPTIRECDARQCTDDTIREQGGEYDARHTERDAVRNYDTRQYTDDTSRDARHEDTERDAVRSYDTRSYSAEWDEIQRIKQVCNERECETRESGEGSTTTDNGMDQCHATSTDEQQREYTTLEVPMSYMQEYETDSPIPTSV